MFAVVSLLNRLLALMAVLVIIALMGGASSALFLWALEAATQQRQAFPVLLFGLPVAGALIGYLYQRAGKRITGGNLTVLGALRQPDDAPLPWAMAPLILVSTVLTHLVGGSAGREGTAVQMSAALADQLSRWQRRWPRVPWPSRTLILQMGIAAGFGAVFGTPWAGAVFALEVNPAPAGASERWRSVALAAVPVALAAWLADTIAILMGAGHLHYPFEDKPGTHLAGLAAAAGVGLASGLSARAFIRATHRVSALSQRLPWPWLRPAIGGTLLLVIYLLPWGSARYHGLGLDVIVGAFGGETLPWDFALKLALTALTLGVGFKGGEVTPLFFIGATLGAVLAPGLGLSVPVGAAVGFVSVFAGAAHVPLACLVMGLELFGGAPLLPLAVGAFIAHWVTGRGGIYRG